MDFYFLHSYNHWEEEGAVFSHQLTEHRAPCWRVCCNCSGEDWSPSAHPCFQKWNPLVSFQPLSLTSILIHFQLNYFSSCCLLTNMQHCSRIWKIHFQTWEFSVLCLKMPIPISWPFADDVDYRFPAKEINRCYKKLINALFLCLLGSGMSNIRSPDLK